MYFGHKAKYERNERSIFQNELLILWIRAQFLLRSRLVSSSVSLFILNGWFVSHEKCLKKGGAGSALANLPSKSPFFVASKFVFVTWPKKINSWNYFFKGKATAAIGVCIIFILNCNVFPVHYVSRQDTFTESSIQKFLL